MYIYHVDLFLRFFKTHNLRLAYSKIEEVNKISELNHKSVRSVLNYLDIKKILKFIMMVIFQQEVEWVRAQVLQ